MVVAALLRVSSVRLLISTPHMLLICRDLIMLSSWKGVHSALVQFCILLFGAESDSVESDISSNKMTL